MKVSISAAKAQLTGLVKKAERGEEVIFTRRGKDIARLTPLTDLPNAELRTALMRQAQMSAKAKLRPGDNAARSQDFLYDESGLPK